MGFSSAPRWPRLWGGRGQEQAQLTPPGSPAAPGAVPLAPASGLVGTRARPAVTGHTHGQEGDSKHLLTQGRAWLVGGGTVPMGTSIANSSCVSRDTRVSPSEAPGLKVFTKLEFLANV